MKLRIIPAACALVALTAAPALADPAPQPLCEDVGTTTGAYWTAGGKVETIPGTTLRITGKRKASWSSSDEIAFVSVVVQTAPGQYEQHFVYGPGPGHYRAVSSSLHAVTVCVV